MNSLKKIIFIENLIYPVLEDIGYSKNNMDSFTIFKIREYATFTKKTEDVIKRIVMQIFYYRFAPLDQIIDIL